MEYCCCGTFTVRTGTFKIGVLALAFACQGIMRYTHGLVTLYTQPDRNDSSPGLLGFIISDAGGLAADWNIILCWGIPPSFSVILLCCIALFIGVAKNNVKLVRPWYYWANFMLCVAVVAVLSFAGHAFFRGQVKIGLLAIFGIIFIYFFVQFLLSIVKSYIDELREAENRERRVTWG